MPPPDFMSKKIIFNENATNCLWRHMDHFIFIDFDGLNYLRYIIFFKLKIEK
jgi:hypothetical protein